MTARVTFLCSVLLTAALAVPAAARADTEEASNFSGIFQVDVTNAYFFRGILQERDGVQIQPWMELYYSLYSSEDGFLRDVSVGGGTWLSFQSERTGADNYPQWLYEGDYYPLIALGFAGGVGLTTTYYFYTSPNGAFDTVQELNFKLTWDDSEAFGRFAVHPWANLAIETHRTSFGPNEGVGLQVGLGPTLYATEDGSFTLTAPIEAGFSLDDYYEGSSGGNHSFGYANAGLLASYPLSFIPESAGAWSVSVSGKYFIFNQILDDYNEGHGTQFVGMASLGVAF